MDEIEALIEALPEPVIDLLSELQDEVEELQKALDAAQAAVPDPEPATDDTPEVAFAKALDTLPAEVAAQVRADRERLALAEAEIAKAQAAEAEMVWVNKAEKMPYLVAEPQNLGVILHKMAGAFPQEVSYIESLLDLANERLEFSKLFSEIGGSTPLPGSINDRLTTIAKSIQSQNPGMSDEAARASAWEQNPELYEAHLAERRS